MFQTPDKNSYKVTFSVVLYFSEKEVAFNLVVVCLFVHMKHCLNNFLLQGRNTGELLAQRTFCVLMNLLQLHPPTTIVAMSMYHESFVHNKSNENSDGQEWNFIESIIR